MPTRSNETLAEELKRYVRFTESDAAVLAAFAAKVAPHLPRIAQDFYERVREHEDAHAVLTGDEQVARLQRSMVDWLTRLFGGVYDEAYFARTERIGRVHVTVGLPPRYMPVAMSMLRVALDARIDIDADDPVATRRALYRLLDVELAVMENSYRSDLLERIERANRLDQEALSRRMQRAEKRYEDAVELAPVLVVALDADGCIVSFNREAERVSGWARDEVVGTSFVERLIPEPFREICVRALGASEPTSCDLAFLTRSGRLRDVACRVAPAPANAPPQTFVFATDVTDARAEGELLRRQERLAAVGTLAAGLAHEIRNPLNGALLHVSFLERALRGKGPDDEAREALKVVDDEIRRLGRLVTDFLDFARPRPLALAPTSARTLCERAAQLLAATAKAAQATLTLDLPTTEIVFQADAQRLEQVLLNLLANAVEALAATGGGQVVLRARREPRGIVFEVDDNGPGLPVGSPIFDAFYSTKPDGTGLGLAIAHRIVADHAGSLGVESKPGLTRFRVRLPLVQQGTTP